MALDETTLKVGDRVTYEDQANPRRTYTVKRVGVRYFSLLCDETGEITMSDCRQYGWNSVNATRYVAVDTDASPQTAVIYESWASLVAAARAQMQEGCKDAGDDIDFSAMSDEDLIIEWLEMYEMQIAEIKE